MKRFRKSRLLWLCFFLLCCTYMTGISAEGKQKKVIRVGYFDYNGFIERDGYGEFSGYGAEYLEELSSYTGWEYEYVYGSWTDCLERLKNGEIDLLCPAQYTKERAEFYDYCDYSSGVEYTLLYTRSDNEEIYYEDYENINGKKVGMMKGSFQNEQFYEFQKEHNLEVEPVYFNSNLEMQDALLVGVVDVIVSGSMDNSAQLKLIGKIGITPFYFITAKGDIAVLEELNRAMKQLQLDKPFLNEELYEKYYGNPENILVELTRKEAEFVKEAQTLTIGCIRGSSPMEYEDKKTKEAVGVYPDILRKVFAYAGLDVEFVIVPTSIEGIAMMNEGKLDMLVSIYGNEELAEEYNIRYTNPYITGEVVALAQRGSGVERKETVVVAIPNISVKYIMYLQEHYPDWIIQDCENNNKCIEAVADKQVDVALVDAMYLQTYDGSEVWQELSFVSGMEMEIPMSIGVSMDCPEELVSVLNKAIFKITDSDIKEARIESTTGIAPRFDLRKWIRNNWPPILMIILVCAVATFIVLRKKELYYRRLAMTDELTGVWNRNKFIREAENLLNHNRNKEYYIISTDVDKFKYINDTFGYNVGDEVLKEEAYQFARIFINRGIFARIAADEFVGLIGCDDKEEESLLWEKIQTFENNMRNYSNQYFRIQIKIGIYKIEKRESDIRVTECIDRANIAKKRIKGNLNQVVAYFDDETAKRSALENEIESKMEKALENGEFCVYYQPKYNLQTEEIESAEALVRWIEPDRGMIRPNFFIPLFEKNGFIVRLDFFVYEEICRHLQKWIREGRRVVPISVNVSRIHLGTPNFIPDLVALLKQYEIPVELLELELTESVFSDDEEAMKNMVLVLKNIGFRISIDDFGSGYSSLNLLKQIPADVLKIDRGFLEEIEDSVKSKVIISQVVSMARKIEIHTVCEGVETKKQADFLRKIQCEVAQGYLFSRPLPVEEFEGKITGQS